jgi:hypothetical protein
VATSQSHTLALCVSICLADYLADCLALCENLQAKIRTGRGNATRPAGLFPPRHKIGDFQISLSY